jgi:hypothetical protein
VELEAT